MILHRLHQAGNILTVKRADLLLLYPAQLTAVRRIGSDVPQLYGLFQRFMQHAMDVLHRLGRQRCRLIDRLSVLLQNIAILVMATNLSPFPKHLVVESLDIQPAQLLQLPASQRGQDVVANVLGVVKPGRGLNPFQEIPLLSFQPLSKGHIGRLLVFVVIKHYQGSLLFL